MPLLGLVFQTNTPRFAKHHRKCLGATLTWAPGYYATPRGKKQSLGNSRLEGRCDHLFLVWCIIVCGKVQKNLMITRLWTGQYVLEMVEVVKMLSLVGDMTVKLVFYSGNGSQNDATWEKNNKSLVCCIKSRRKLTSPDSWWGIMLNCVETCTENPVRNASNTCFGQKVLFHYMGDKCHYYRTGAWLGWERIQSALWAINSPVWHCVARNYRTDVSALQTRNGEGNREGRRELGWQKRLNRKRKVRTNDRNRWKNW